jgi:hypothetical protein
MREKQEVLEKFYQLRALKLKERKEQFLGRKPRNCFFNFRQHVKENGDVGFCQNPVIVNTIRTKVFVCNNDDTVKRCRCFQCRSTDESVERDFNEVLKSPARCGQEYPKLAILIWFLQDSEPQTRFARFVKVLSSIGKWVGRLIFFRWW